MSSTPTIRASSLSDLFDCPARWAAKHIDGKYMPRTSRAQLGTAVHASTAAYDTSVLTGAGMTVDEAAAAAVDAVHNPTEEVDWEDEKPADIEKIAVALHTKYCTIVAPKQNYRAVEVKCNGLYLEDLRITLTGTTDRIRSVEHGGFGISDIKTGKNAVGADGTVATKGHTYQIGVYELIGEFGSGLRITEPGEIIGLQTAKTDKSQRVGTGLITGAREVLIGTEETPGILATAANIIHRGDFWGNPKSMMCSEKYCPVYNSCNYRK